MDSFVSTLRLALVGLLFSTFAHAASYQTAVATGLSRAGTGWTFASSGAVAANQAFNVSPTIRAAGKAVTMPASARFASNAARFAVGAIRLNPAGLAVGLAATWLASYGLEYAQDHWNFASGNASVWGGCITAVNTGSDYGCTIPANGNMSLSAVKSWADSWAAGQGCTVAGTTWAATTYGNWSGYRKNYSCTGGWWRTANVAASGCPQQTNAEGVCATGSVRPATDADWENVSSQPLPDNVAQDLARKDVPIPVEAPKLGTTPVVEPIGDPYTDPISKTTKRDYVQVTPSPTADDPLRVRVDPFTKTVDANGEPTTAPAEASKTDPPDVCEKNPEAALCQKLDKPDMLEESVQNRTISITPDTGWGPDAGSCPADVQLKAGPAYSFKPACDFFSGVRPAVIAAAWITAVLIALSLGAKGG